VPVTPSRSPGRWRGQTATTKSIESTSWWPSPSWTPVSPRRRCAALSYRSSPSPRDCGRLGRGTVQILDRASTSTAGHPRARSRAARGTAAGRWLHRDGAPAPRADPDGCGDAHAAYPPALYQAWGTASARDRLARRHAGLACRRAPPWEVDDPDPRPGGAGGSVGDSRFEVVRGATPSSPTGAGSRSSV
jgi:hypothetical protein